MSEIIIIFTRKNYYKRVIVKDMESDSGKADQAKKLNIPLLPAKEFEEKYLN